IKCIRSMGRCKVKVRHFASLLVKMNSSYVKSRGRFFFSSPLAISKGWSGAGPMV
uniref:Uncharacterized protein n=1 Tax=Equus asinus TaxID=9793 RepID=A0A8C4MPU3_EQUAS